MATSMSFVIAVRIIWCFFFSLWIRRAKKQWSNMDLLHPWVKRRMFICWRIWYCLNLTWSLHALKKSPCLMIRYRLLWQSATLKLPWMLFKYRFWAYWRRSISTRQLHSNCWDHCFQLAKTNVFVSFWCFDNIYCILLIFTLFDRQYDFQIATHRFKSTLSFRSTIWINWCIDLDLASFVSWRNWRCSTIW